MKKLISIIMLIAMLLTSTAVFAETEADVWDRTIVEEGEEVVYEDFPILINKNVDSEMNMDLSFVYLKNLNASSTASISFKDNSTNEIAFSKKFAVNDTSAKWENIENNKSYTVTVSENINGVSATYEKLFETSYVSIDFPINAVIGNKTINNHHGEEIPFLMIKKVGDNYSCGHDENEECTDDCSPVKKIMPEDFNTFFSTLDADTLYETQLSFRNSGHLQQYRGFISTASEFADLGIFTKGYSLTDIVDNSVSTFGLPSDLTPVEWEYFETGYTNIQSEALVKWTPPETGYYTIETVGNTDPEIRYYDSETATNYSPYYDGGTGNNVKFTIGTVAGYTRYFHILPENSSTTGYVGFKIIYDDAQGDELPNFVDEVQTSADNGVYSEYEYENVSIDYTGDVEFLVYNVTSTRAGSFEMSSRATALVIEGYTGFRNSYGYDSLWSAFNGTSEAYSGSGDPIEVDIPISSFQKERYYIKIYSTKKLSDDADISENGTFDIRFYPPNRMDEGERAVNSVEGATPVTPINVSLTEGYDASGFYSIHTIHSPSDSDFFKIDMTNETEEKVLTATLTKEETTSLYDITLYDNLTITSTDPHGWSTGTAAATGVITEYDYSDENNIVAIEKTITYTMQPGKAYYLEVTGDASRYSIKYKYGIDIDVSVVDTTPSAVLSGDVALSHTSGTNITSLDSFISQIMTSLTCYEGTTEIADETATANVALYYNDALLTADIVNALSENDYTLTVKYKDAVATGGTITLTVAAPTPVEQDIVELTGTLDKSTTSTTARDWFYCARSFANYKRVANGETAASFGISTVVNALKANDSNLTLTTTQRADLTSIANASWYFYTNGESCIGHIDDGGGLLYGESFDNVTIDVIYSHINANSPVILQLVDTTAPTDMTKARYIMVYGVNKTASQLRIYDPIKSNVDWVDWSVLFDGGYVEDNANVKFDGGVIFDPDL